MQEVIDRHANLIDTLVPKIWRFMDLQERKSSAKQLASVIPYLLGVHCGEGCIHIKDVPVDTLLEAEFWVEYQDLCKVPNFKKKFMLAMRDGCNSKRAKMPIPFANPFGEFDDYTRR